MKNKLKQALSNLCQNRSTVVTLSVATSLLFTTVACSRANRSAMGAWWGCRHKVSLYSGGTLVGQWITSGKVENESSSDGYYFTNDATGKLITITGDVVIEVL